MFDILKKIDWQGRFIVFPYTYYCFIQQQKIEELIIKDTTIFFSKSASYYKTH